MMWGAASITCMRFGHRWMIVGRLYVGMAVWTRRRCSICGLEER